MLWKMALHSVSYAGVWPGQARLPLDLFLEKAKALGYDSVMLMAKRPHLSLLDADAAARNRLRDKLASLNLEVASLAGYTDFCLGSERPDIPTREMQILYVTELARLARDLKCGLVRVFTGYTTAAATLDQGWNWCVASLRECAQRAADLGVTIGVQNHHDTAAHYESLFDLLAEIDEPNCKAMFDAWSPALHGSDLAAAVRKMAPYIVHTTVADYVRRPRFSYAPQLVNYVRENDAIRAVPMGEGFIDYRGFFGALKEAGYRGHVAYEMCSALRGGGGEANLDRCAKQFIDYMRGL
ncbi:MAG TPA: sugar phosphate isomerase/epimerase family protein [Planctomycetaceae bacterium]|nr:sugar phosphate isomerase/epimerase family protein [Planctomycetaceae bacterium]